MIRKILCKIGIHSYKPFTRSGEVNWHIITIKGKRCKYCHKEILE